METRCVKKARFFVVRCSLSFRSETKRKFLTVLLVLFLLLVFPSVADIYLVVGFAAGFPAVAGVPTVVDAPAVAGILLFLAFLLLMMASLLLLTCTVATWRRDL
jgi:hypothetical protein